MLKLRQMDDVTKGIDNPLGMFRSYVEVAEFIEENYKSPQTFLVIPMNFKKLSALRKVEYDGFSVHVEGYGNV